MRKLDLIRCASLAIALCACGEDGSTPARDDASAPPPAPADSGAPASPATDASLDARAPTFGPDASQDPHFDSGLHPGDCAYGDAGAELDPSTSFDAGCAGGCPEGTVCAVNGRRSPGGAAQCVPIVHRCAGNATCACMARCVCGFIAGNPVSCIDVDAGIPAIICEYPVP